MNSRTEVGFSQRLRLEWLAQAASLAAAGVLPTRARALLNELLRDDVSVGGAAERSNRSKAVTVLMQTWVTPPAPLLSVRDDGLTHRNRLPGTQHLPLHWGMCAAVYPFFGGVAEVSGRLLRLQGVVTAREVQRRLRERHGERETVFRATRRVLRTFIDCGVLQDDARGVYRAGDPHRITDPGLTAWIFEAALHAVRRPAVALGELADGPTLFPFVFDTSPEDALYRHPRLELLRQGLDQEVLTFRKQRVG